MRMSERGEVCQEATKVVIYKRVTTETSLEYNSTHKRTIDSSVNRHTIFVDVGIRSRL